MIAVKAAAATIFPLYPADAVELYVVYELAGYGRVVNPDPAVFVRGSTGRFLDPAFLPTTYKEPNKKSAGNQRDPGNVTIGDAS